MTLVANRKLRYFIITLRLQKLFMSPKISKHMIWNHLHDVVDESWCTFSIMKPGSSLIGCVRNFEWNHGTYMFGYIQMDSIHSGYLLHHILIGWWYWWFKICHWECVWGWSSCSYLWLYTILIVQVGIYVFVFDCWFMSWSSCGSLKL
jgi:hypothetical protein